MSPLAQIALILVAGAIAMMLIAAFTKRGLRLGRCGIIFSPPAPPSLNSGASKAVASEPKRPRASKRSGG